MIAVCVCSLCVRLDNVAVALAPAVVMLLRRLRCGRGMRVSVQHSLRAAGSFANMQRAL